MSKTVSEYRIDIGIPSKKRDKKLLGYFYLSNKRVDLNIWVLRMENPPYLQSVQAGRMEFSICYMKVNQRMDFFFFERISGHVRLLER